MISVSAKEEEDDMIEVMLHHRSGDREMAIVRRDPASGGPPVAMTYRCHDGRARDFCLLRRGGSLTAPAYSENGA